MTERHAQVAPSQTAAYRPLLSGVSPPANGPPSGPSTLASRNQSFLLRIFVTPSGIEGGPNVTGDRRTTRGPSEGLDQARPGVEAECNECNEALDAARKPVAAALRLAMVADNAIANGDLKRARGALRDLQDALGAVTAGERSRVVLDG